MTFKDIPFENTNMNLSHMTARLEMGWIQFTDEET